MNNPIMFGVPQNDTVEESSWLHEVLVRLSLAVLFVLPTVAWCVFMTRYTGGLSYSTLSIGESVSTHNSFGHFMYDVLPNACLTVGNFLLTTLVLYVAYVVPLVPYWTVLLVGIDLFDEWIDSEPNSVQVKVRGNTIKTIETVRFPLARRPEYRWKEQCSV